ncbi:synapse-associated protein of 47 kDa-like [Lycorma delicatula]
MKKLGITDDAQSRSAKNEEEWEKELEAELQDYEVVADDDNSGSGARVHRSNKSKHVEDIPDVEDDLK